MFDGQIEPSYGAWYGFSTRLVMITSPVEDLLDRILVDEDTGRRSGRSLFGSTRLTVAQQIAFLERAQQLSAEVMQRVSREYGRPHYIVDNHNGRLHVALDRLRRIITGSALQ